METYVPDVQLWLGVGDPRATAPPAEHNNTHVETNLITYYSGSVQIMPMYEIVYICFLRAMTANTRQDKHTSR